MTMRILYLVLNPAPEQTMNEISSRVIPSDRMYGLYELGKLGHEVRLLSMRPKGPFRRIFKFLNERFQFCLPDLAVLPRLKDYDVVVVNGPFSTLVTVAARLQHKKLVYLDTILRLPSSVVRKKIYALNVLLSSGTVMYTRIQARQCARALGIDEGKFKLIPFAIDFSFYEQFQAPPGGSSERYVLAVGRDQGRDYGTLVKAAQGAGVKVKIVTLPYLLEGITIDEQRVEVLGNVSYAELYRLYAQAAFVIIPLKGWATGYSSGTRALLEAMAMNKCVVATHSPPLEEYARDGDGVLYVAAEDQRDLTAKMESLLNDTQALEKLEAKVESNKEAFDIRNFALAFSQYLSEL